MLNKRTNDARIGGAKWKASKNMYDINSVVYYSKEYSNGTYIYLVIHINHEGRVSLESYFPFFNRSVSEDATVLLLFNEKQSIFVEV